MKFLFIFYKERLFFGKTNEKKSVLGFLLISAFNSSFCGGISVIKLTTFSSLMEIVFLLSISNWSCERNHSKVQPFISTLFNPRIPKNTDEKLCFWRGWLREITLLHWKKFLTSVSFLKLFWWTLSWQLVWWQ